MTLTGGEKKGDRCRDASALERQREKTRGSEMTGKKEPKGTKMRDESGEKKVKKPGERKNRKNHNWKPRNMHAVGK